MRPNRHVCGGGTVGSDRKEGRRTPILRYAALIVVAVASTGCADDVVLKNPRTGATEVCRDSLRGLDPWSQTMACVANYEAQGWIRTGQQ